MTTNKTPVILVAVVLLALIIIPLIVLMVSRGDNSTSTLPHTQELGPIDAHTTVAVDYELRQLVERAEHLVGDDLAVALRQGDVSLDFMANLNADIEQAHEALADGRLEEAERSYTSVVELAEAKLGALQLADAARTQSEATYAELKRLDYLQAVFANTYGEAVERYDQGLHDLNAKRFKQSLDAFAMTDAILGDLESRSIQQIGGMLEAANLAVAECDVAAAQTAFEKVLQIDSTNTAAIEGLAMANALAEISADVQTVQSLEASGELNAALAQVDELLALHANNLFLLNERRRIEALIADRDHQAAVDAARLAERSGDLAAAVSALETALAIRSSPELNDQLKQLKARERQARLEVLLETAYNALQAGNYDAARKGYKEALALAPESKEARTGLEKASGLYLANIRYSQNLNSAAKYLLEGRFPLAAKFFNDAMASRPSAVPSGQALEESRIRRELALQSDEVDIRIVSDKKTYVSLIGVFAPERLRSKDLKLFPDVYTLKGTRKGYQPIEVEFKLTTNSRKEFEVICTEKK